MSGNPLKKVLGEAFFRALPKTPGVYFMAGASGRLLYVGKAKNLRARLTSYARLRADRADDERDDRMLELIERVQAIRWESHRTEIQALARESELLRALRPPYNVAGTDDELYLYIGIRVSVGKTGAAPCIDFRLSNWPDFAGEGYEIFGAYRHRRKVKLGYCALLRLVHAYQCASPRFSYPARITRSSPAWDYHTRFPMELQKPLRDFLAGRSRGLLKRIFDGMLENEHIPAFMRPSIQDDIETVKELYRRGPGITRQLKRRHGHHAQVVQPEQMSQMVERDVMTSIF